MDTTQGQLHQLEGEWSVTLKSPAGLVTTVLILKVSNGTLTGSQSGQGTSSLITDATFDGCNISWINEVTKPMKLKVQFRGTVDGDTMTGKAKAGFMGSIAFNAVRQGSRAADTKSDAAQTVFTKADDTLYWDPYRPDINLNPYPVYGRLRKEAPLYYNAEYDFYAVSRFADVDKCLSDRETFISGRSDILEFIKSPDMEVPSGMFIWEDPPNHTVHRAALSRAFSPKRMAEIEPLVRKYCARCLDPLIGSDRIDFITDFGAQLPGGVIGMLLGIPDEDRDIVRDRVDAMLRTESGKPMTASQLSIQGEGFEEYIDWRVKNPSDDLMTELLNLEFQDETGATRKLTRQEILVFTNLLAGAGNETTARLIGWIGKVLSDHPDQRRQLALDRRLIPAAIEEILRFEPPGPSVARYVAKDIEIHGKVVPEGSAMLCFVASANRDEQRFPNGDRFDIHRTGAPHITFGRGIHSCIGSALARIEGRVALDELLKRFPDWTVDMDGARMTPSSTTRGWDVLPAYTR